jgi:hypothetical protein
MSLIVLQLYYLEFYHVNQIFVAYDFFNLYLMMFYFYFIIINYTLIIAVIIILSFDILFLFIRIDFYIYLNRFQVLCFFIEIMLIHSLNLYISHNNHLKSFRILILILASLLLNIIYHLFFYFLNVIFYLFFALRSNHYQ